MNHSHKHEPKTSEGRPAHPTRRSLMAAGVSMALASPLLSATLRPRLAGVSSPRGLASIAGARGNALDSLMQLAAGTNLSVFAGALPKLTVQPILSGDSGDLPAAYASVASALDVLGDLTSASLATLGPEFLSRFLLTDYTSYAAALTAIGEDCQGLLDSMASIGIPDGEVAAVMASIGALGAVTGGNPLAGLGQVTQARLDSIAANIPNYVGSMPERCAVTVAGATFTGMACSGLVDGSIDQGLGLGSAFIGVTFAGIGLSLLP